MGLDQIRDVLLAAGLTEEAGAFPHLGVSFFRPVATGPWSIGAWVPLDGGKARPQPPDHPAIHVDVQHRGAHHPRLRRVQAPARPAGWDEREQRRRMRKMSGSSVRPSVRRR